MIIDFLVSQSGVRADSVTVTITGAHLKKGGEHGLVPASAETVQGTVRLRLEDLTAALARPELVDQLIAQVAGLAKPELALANGEDGSIRVTGSVEVLGRRLPVTASSDVLIQENRVVMSATHLQGLPVLGQLSIHLLDLVLPLTLPEGFRFTGASVEEGAIVVAFEGVNVALPGAPS